jgi:hypothetical protein
MSTIQIVLQDFEYARTLEALFSGDGYAVTVRYSPDLNLGGVIVLDAGWMDRVEFGKHAERLVVITSRDASINLADMWAAGIRSLVHREDPIENARLAILAAELRLRKRDSQQGPRPAWQDPDTRFHQGFCRVVTKW